MESKEENKQYAYVWLLMKGDAYMPGVLASAFSLILTQTSYDLVCMTTPDVSEEAKETMHKFNIITVDVPYISFKVANIYSTKQKSYYDSWLTDAFTKWNCLNLTSYDKVLLIDADTIILENIDKLFELRAPAAPFNSQYNINKSKGFLHGENVSIRYIKNILGPHNDEYKEQKLMRNKKSVSLTASTILLKPGADIFQEYLSLMKKVSSGVNGFGFPLCTSMADEQSISYFYCMRGEPWINISEDYNLMGWKSRAKPKVLHYIATKPWKITEKELREWPDMIYWYRVLIKIYENPDLHNKFLQPLRELIDYAKLM